jgi:DNA-binding GntR family transcriptional regulator
VGLSDQGRGALSDIEVFQEDALARILDQLDGRQLDRLTRALDDLRGAVTRVSEAEPELFAHNHQFHEPHADRSPSPPKS